MRVLLCLLALFTVGCGDDPLAPTAPDPIPAPPVVALCEAPVPPSPNNGHFLCVVGQGCIFIAEPVRTALVPCD